MDGTTIIIVGTLLVLVAVSSFLVFRKRTRISLDISRGKLELEGDNKEEVPPPAQIRAKDVAVEEGGLLAQDDVGGGIDVEGVKTKDDVLLHSQKKT